MKRLNPVTNKPFKRGDPRSDGFVFKQYFLTKVKKDGYFVELWYSKNANDKIVAGEKESQRKKYLKSASTLTGHVRTIFSGVKSRCKLKGIPFDLTLEYLESIVATNCPVFGFPLAWCAHSKNIKPVSPSLDRINPKLGYIKGNVRWLSQRANAMKQDSSPEELAKFANWILTSQA